MATVNEWKDAGNAAALNEVYRQYQEGWATPQQALRALCMELGEVESEIGPLQVQRDTLREQIGDLVARIGETVEIAGFGTLRITAPSITKGYDTKAVKGLIEEWSADFPEFAERLAACEKQTMRAGGLRIEREK